MMKKMLRTLGALAATLIFLQSLSGCKNDYPDSVYNPDAPPGATPVIASLSPEGEALAGVGIITITGQNFSATPEENFVFFDAMKAGILEASTTQLVVRAPNLVSDSVSVKIAVDRVELFSAPFIYSLIPAVEVFGRLENAGQDATQAFGIAVDLNENVYVSVTGKQIKKVAPDGTTTLFAEPTFLQANALRIGPAGGLYAVSAAGRVRKVSVFSTSGTESTLASFTKTPVDLDFDEAGNLWVALVDEIHIIKPDNSKNLVASYAADLNAIRVYNGFLYVAGRDNATSAPTLWRSQIQGDALGASEVVLDGASAIWLEDADILSFTFSAAGEIFLGTTHPSGIFVYTSDGDHSELYPGLLEPNIYSLVWGNANLMYAMRQTVNPDLGDVSKLLKIDLARNGAPYYGRK